jgi:GNAT superfamily N-acetyltransferase
MNAGYSPYDLDLLRNEFGTSTKLWTGQGLHRVEADRWIALSHIPAVEHNVIVCHGPHRSGVVAQSLEDIRQAKVPGIIMLAGRALESAQVMVDAGWTCIGEGTFMALAELPTTPDPEVRRMGPDDLPTVHAILAESFRQPLEVSSLTVPVEALALPEVEGWLLDAEGGIRSVTAAVQVDNGVSIWSMATPLSDQHRGYGRRLLITALARAGENGCDHSTLLASTAGEPLYRSLGYEVLEHWQKWSRPRWVLGQS